jgi:hypothetical protein
VIVRSRAMRIYQWLMKRLMSVLVVSFALVAIAMSGPMALLTAIAVGVIGAVARLSAVPPEKASWSRRTRAVVFGWWVSWGWLAVVGVTAVFGPASVPLFEAVAVLAMPLVGSVLLGTCLPAQQAVVLRRLQSVTLVELMDIWRASATLLTDVSCPRDGQAVIALRARCLDELERRDPIGFDRWLAAGPVGADPGAYLSTSC